MSTTEILNLLKLAFDIWAYFDKRNKAKKDNSPLT